MKILAIRGRNLASLADDFEVDFTREPLAQAGLFALSGPTGSGKSTLLDALCLALYGATPRLQTATSTQIPDVHDEQVTAADPRNLLRRGKGEGFAEVDFVGVDGLAYRARWSVKRARSRSDGRLQAAEYLLTRVADGQPVVGTRKTDVHPEIQRLVGLSFSQFTRAVLLAQNDFAAFLKAADDERAALLQTLTGTGRFELISCRVYERHVTEKTRLDDLERQRTETPPQEPAARAALDQALAAARQALADTDAQKRRLEATLRWHQDGTALARAVQAAETALSQAVARQAEAGPRYGQLKLADAVAPARALEAECVRLEAEARQAEQVHSTRRQAHQAALGVRQAAEAARAQAQTQLDTAHAARQGAQADLDGARTLDTQIQTLTPQWEAARKHQQDAQTRQKDCRQARDGLIQERDQATESRNQASAWLAEHAALAPLAGQWPHWTYLLDQAARHQAAIQASQSALAQGKAAETRARRALAKAETVWSSRDSARQAAEAGLAEARSRLVAFDPEALARTRSALESARARLTAVQAAWNAWQMAETALAEAHKARTALVQEQQAQIAEGARLAALRPVLTGRLQQAEASLKRAAAACNQDVDSLRAGLAPDRPCPVCGALEHPYHDPGASHRLRELLIAEQTAHTQLLGESNALDTAEAALNATLKHQAEQLAQLDAQVQAHTRKRDPALAAWEALLAQDLEDGLTRDLNQGQGQTLGQALADADISNLTDWFQARGGAQDQALQALIAQETALRGAQKQRDIAQEQLNQADKAAREATAARQSAQEALNGCLQTLTQEEARLAQGSATLEAALTELDIPLVAWATAADGLGQAGAAGWRTRWRQDPAAFQAGLSEQVLAWQARQETNTSLARSLEALAHRIGSAETLLAQASASLGQAEAELTRQAAALEEKRQDRAKLLAGKPVAEVEAALNTAVAQAQELANTRIQALDQALHQDTQAVTALDLAQSALNRCRQDRDAALMARDSWLDRFNQNAPVPLDREGLHQLLALAPDWLAAERQALATLERDVAAARTVLEERGSQLENHQARAPEGTDPARSGEDWVNQLNAVEALWTQHRSEVTTREVLQRQDDERRARQAELTAKIQAQSAVAAVWARLNDMVGSADGRKFRRIAQQHTLEVLVGYANRHLADLSRRYRLERLPDSLTLLVVDQDMADERRSVHSLSGGESFLVSLALALGLASLSSHSVKVESLFIDEGFGSLDAETLAVAMNALDNLQAQGRKVGVISHVQEMTERIGVRVEVTPGSGGRSRLRVWP